MCTHILPQAFTYPLNNRNNLPYILQTFALCRWAADWSCPLLTTAAMKCYEICKLQVGCSPTTIVDSGGLLKTISLIVVLPTSTTALGSVGMQRDMEQGNLLSLCPPGYSFRNLQQHKSGVVIRHVSDTSTMNHLLWLYTKHTSTLDNSVSG